MSFTGVGEVASLIRTTIDKIWPDKSEQEKLQLEAAMTALQGQLEINKTEAASPSLFVSGWRPFIGWVCGAACAWNWLGLSIAQFGLKLYGSELVLEQADITEMWPVLLGMLGLGAFRTYERVKGSARV